MTSPKTGDTLRYLRTGGLFEVRKVTRDFIILCARDGSSQLMTGKGSLEILFSRVPPQGSAPMDRNALPQAQRLGCLGV